jgi:hypothetical protein
MTDLGMQVFRTIFGMRPDLKDNFGFKGLVSAQGLEGGGAGVGGERGQVLLVRG